MVATRDDYFTKVGSPGTATTLSSPGHSIGGGTFNVGSTSNWDTTTGVVFAVDTYTLQTINGVQTAVRNPGTYTEWEGVVSGGTQITNAIIRYGTDQNYPAGSTTRVYIPVASSRENRIVDGLLNFVDQDATLKAGAVDNAAVLASNVVTTAKILDANVTDSKIAGVSSSKLTNPYAFSVYRNSAWTDGNGGFSAVTFDTVEFDNGSNYSTSTGRFTVPTGGAGIYKFSASTSSTVTASNTFSIAIYKNGVNTKQGQTGANATINTAQRVVSTPPMKLAVGDYIQVYSYGTGGAGNTGASATYFGGEFVSL